MIFEQDRLNLTNKKRTSRLPWRGQFSPELIEYFISDVCLNCETFYDPFCGSGTVLFEASIAGKTSYGSEINPAAWCLASLSTLSQLPLNQRKSIKLELQNFFLRSDVDAVILEEIKNHKDVYVKIALSSAILLGMKNSKNFNVDILRKGAKVLFQTLDELPLFIKPTYCHLEDARFTSLSDQSIDAVITSPPYINVFNYHQNYRPAIELLDWKPLDAAKSEIGANRKFRQNRFLTVVQYAIDMGMTLNELVRVTRDNAKIIMVVGRQSNVLGASFENSKIISDLANNTNQLILKNQAERVFKNMFGENIIEDILIFEKKSSERHIIKKENSIKIGVEMLNKALKSVPEKNMNLLQDAIKKGNLVTESQQLTISNPLIEGK
ncbi:DNA methyltransferase [Citrobacter koseri]|uniref:DNA methyltransferase n=1 Tax=Citrobacter koseri TaxID=545 RepID=UPI003CF62C8A